MRHFVKWFTPLFLMLLTIVPATAQETTTSLVQLALEDMSERTGQTVNLSTITSWTYQRRVYPDASLGCAQPGQVYAQVQTPAYQFDISYRGQTYDYRVAEDGSAMIFCGIAQAPDQPPVGSTPPAGQPTCDDPYTVDFGDTLYEIARSCNTSVDALLAANPDIENPAIIYIGQEIAMPDGGSDDEFTPEPQPISISPMAGPPGTSVTVSASGFAPAAQVDIGFGPWESEYDVLTTVQAQADGSVSATVPVPDFADPDNQWVFVAAVPGGRSLTSGFFEVTGHPSTPEAPRFTSANIFLVALEDAGQTGMEIGCGDSLVPVEVTFAPTVAPLTAALEELFSINSEFYGQSGLYNALYQSDLTIDGIDITDADVAQIELSGTIRSGGTCDVPRIEAQIEQTALQYGTIDRVSITVNGQPLADALN